MTINIRKIVSATRDYCRKDGHGMQIVVWRDGSYDVAHSENDIVARSRFDGSWEYPFLRLRTPITMVCLKALVVRKLIHGGE